MDDGDFVHPKVSELDGYILYTIYTHPMGSGEFGGCVICIRSIPHSDEIYDVNCDCVSHVFYKRSNCLMHSYLLLPSYPCV